MSSFLPSKANLNRIIQTISLWPKMSMCADIRYWMEEETEGDGERIPGVVYCIFCSNYKEPNPVEPTSLIDSHGMRPILKETCDTCNVKSSDIGICRDCHLTSEVNKNTTILHIRCKLCWNAILADPDIPWQLLFASTLVVFFNALCMQNWMSQFIVIKNW